MQGLLERSVMQSCSSALCILILLISTFTTELMSAVPSVKVKLHDSATLPCSERCSGLVRWTVFTKPTDVLAECDQTSCGSKEGYQMIHDQYLKGNLSLTITDADFNKRGLYTSDCDGKDVCDVQLQIEPLNTSVQIEPKESLFLRLDIPQEVEVYYKSAGAAGPSIGQICTVDGRSLQCKPEYKQRVSAGLELREMTPSDSGVYTVMDKLNEEAIHIYTVSVGSAGGSELQGDHPDLDTDKGAAVPVWVTVLVVLLVVLVAVLVAVIVVLVVVNVWLRREIQQLKKNENNGHCQFRERGTVMHQ
ncbi:uncharacterized protein LOC118803459 [Colossoma macropomum]|uniref:uncharacterized protein LOC118803459 n=1 Tax=Colossoma macropomum TaxID=42526 RepID=UPI001864FDEC|nr:uncharacterized protein LOC118803459 [Colossoma macropomum]